MGGEGGGRMKLGRKMFPGEARILRWTRPPTMGGAGIATSEQG